MKEFNPLEKKPSISKTLKRKLGAIVLSGATLLNTPSSGKEVREVTPYSESDAGGAPLEQIPQTPAQIEVTLGKIAATRTEETIFDNKPEYFRAITKDGDFPSEERRKRTLQLENGSTVFRDVDLLFYKVRKGDTLFSIRSSLARLPEFSYLREQPGKIESFNIPSLELVKDMWIPIPLENKERYLTDEQFARYAAASIDALRFHPKYGEFVNKILKKVSVVDLLATLVAVAKQEAGGQPIGRYELHRWEPRYNVFSFSLFHVLMDGPGLDARRRLNKSEGQLYHPQNACDLFIAYMKEKDGDADDLFPVTKHAESFAKFYNGSGWRRINPNYVRNILRYHADAKEMIQTLLADSKTKPKPIAPTAPTPPKLSPPLPPTPTPEKPPVVKTPEKPPTIKPARPEVAPKLQWEKIGRNNLTIALQNAHYRYTKTHRNETLIKTKVELYRAAKEVSAYLVRKFRSSVYFPNEEIAVGKDRLGLYIKFRSNRQGKQIEDLIRPD